VQGRRILYLDSEIVCYIVRALGLIVFVEIICLHACYVYVTGKGGVVSLCDIYSAVALEP
jgi:hypothetical protein